MNTIINKINFMFHFNFDNSNQTQFSSTQVKKDAYEDLLIQIWKYKNFANLNYFILVEKKYREIKK